MTRSLFSTVSWLVVVMLAAACSTPAGNTVAIGVTGASPTASPPASLPTEDSSGATTPVAVSHGGPVVDYVSLVDQLRGTGATVAPAGEIEQPFFSGKGLVIKVNGDDVQVFEFAAASAADAEASRVAPDGGSIGTNMVSWIAQPHFYKAGKIIVLYVGNPGAVTVLLARVVGAQFAGP